MTYHISTTTELCDTGAANFLQRFFTGRSLAAGRICKQTLYLYLYLQIFGFVSLKETHHHCLAFGNSVDGWISDDWTMIIRCNSDDWNAISSSFALRCVALRCCILKMKLRNGKELIQAKVLEVIER